MRWPAWQGGEGHQIGLEGGQHKALEAIVRCSNKEADNAMIIAEPRHCSICVFEVESYKLHYVTFGRFTSIF